MKDTLTAWRAMEPLVPSKVGSLGVSNTDLASLRQLCDVATVRPVAVQNRFTQNTVDRPDPNMPCDLPYPLVTFDRAVREYCCEQGIAYAPWGVLWGSLDVLDGPEEICDKAGLGVGVNKEIACFALLRSLSGCKISILCGTTNEVRIVETLAGLDRVRRYVSESEENRGTWNGFVGCFRVVVDGGETLK